MGKNKINNLESKIITNKLKILYTNGNGGCIGIIVISFLSVFVLRNQVPVSRLVFWFFACITVSLLGCIVTLIFFKSYYSISNYKRWAIFFTLWNLVLGSFVGSAGVLLFPIGSINHQVFLAFILAGMTVVSIATLSISISAFVTFTFPIMMPLALKFLSLGDEIHLAMGVLALLFYVLMIFTVRIMNRYMSDSLLLKYEKEDIIESLKISEEKYSKAFQYNAIMMGIVALEDGKFIEVNDRLLRVLGLTKDEVLGKRAFDLGVGVFYDINDQERIKKEITEWGFLRDYEFKFYDKNHDLLTVIVSVNLLYLQKKPCLLFMLKDITKEKKLKMPLSGAKNVSGI